MTARVETVHGWPVLICEACGLWTDIPVGPISDLEGVLAEHRRECA